MGNIRTEINLVTAEEINRHLDRDPEFRSDPAYVAVEQAAEGITCEVPQANAVRLIQEFQRAADALALMAALLETYGDGDNRDVCKGVGERATQMQRLATEWYVTLSSAPTHGVDVLNAAMLAASDKIHNNNGGSK